MSTRESANNREFTIVMRGPSAVVFRQNENLIIKNFPCVSGLVNMVYTSRWIKKSETVIVPGQLWIEIKGHGYDLEESLVSFANAGLALLPILAVSANTAIGEPEIEVAFDSTPNVSEHDYFQNYVPPESGVVHFARYIDVKTSAALLDAINRHSESERLRRAANQYRLALDSWKPGRETLSLAHLWMALEALTKARIRFECTARGLSSEVELANILGVETNQLDSAIRRDLILNGDEECYRKSKQASDGFEHGFLGYDKIRELSKDVRHRMAKYIRNAILELSGLEAEPLRVLTSDPYDKPMGSWSIIKYVRGRLLGKSPELAAKGNAYPFLRWKPVINKCEILEDGKINIQVSYNLTVELAEGISFQPISYEAWKPE
ncbi:hypothetical protein [Candidatus Manganitrophus noduliformans]|uniref:Uncharacterized protein n=1 Tax=Candidatus Manganitrophus noduliformans TaxID=2606439 RepID=A0A7X6DTZ4_9BACT|nr:hypothetical protein [Candidatus Manganitrophus noduliformans]NKE72993.1 hypothetical protein [Candidatus Manganitrophus noduliformans]